MAGCLLLHPPVVAIYLLLCWIVMTVCLWCHPLDITPMYINQDSDRDCYSCLTLLNNLCSGAGLHHPKMIIKWTLMTEVRTMPSCTGVSTLTNLRSIMYLTLTWSFLMVCSYMIKHNVYLTPYNPRLWELWGQRRGGALWVFGFHLILTNLPSMQLSASIWIV